MADCHLCGKRLGPREREVQMSGRVFCGDCSPKWPAVHRQRAIEQLYAHGEPEEFFLIPTVYAPCPIYPDRQDCMGDLSFTSAGICLIYITDVKKPDWLGIFAGFLGMFLSWRYARKWTVKAYLEARRYIIEETADFAESLQRAPLLIVIPAQDIVDITYGRRSGFQIKTHAGSVGYRIHGERRTYREYLPQIQEYLRTIGSAENANPYARPS